MIRLSERRDGLVTDGELEIPPKIKDACLDAVKYQPMSYSLLPLILPYVKDSDVFVELGCGKGRVLWFVAKRRRLKKAIGIEIVPELAEIARRNTKLKLLTPVQIIEGNVANADLREGTVYFMANPFGEDTLRRVLRNIETSLLTNPRHIQIVYRNPVWGHVLDNTYWLKPSEKQSEMLGVWHN